jgi:hypothetical protein
MDKIYLAIWKNDYGDEYKAFKSKFAAERQLNKWLGEYIVDTLQDDGLEVAQDFLNKIKINKDSNNDIYYEVEGNNDELYVEIINYDDV